jgi:aspartate aminotransferase-like enzyme
MEQGQAPTMADRRLSDGRWLRIPGPTVVPPRVLAAMTHEMIPHRGPEMQRLLGGIIEKAKTVHETRQHVLVWPGTGSAGWEAAIVNLLSPGDRVVATVCGAFGKRFAEVGTRFGLDVRPLAVHWGQAITPEAFAAALDDAGSVKAVFITHNETSTGVTNPLPELARVANRAGALVIVDAVSSAAAMPLKVDEWELDWVLSGAQKAWMCPPGPMISAISERALAASRTSGYPRFFWDVESMLKAVAGGSTATTAPVSMLYAFNTALGMILDEGLEQAYTRQARLGELTRTGVRKLGLELFAEPGYESASLTAFRPPRGMAAKALRDRVRARTGIEIAIGQGDIADQVNRIGHMGWVAAPEIEATLEAVRAAVTEDDRL